MEGGWGLFLLDSMACACGAILRLMAILRLKRGIFETPKGHLWDSWAKCCWQMLVCLWPGGDSGFPLDGLGMKASDL